MNRARGGDPHYLRGKTDPTPRHRKRAWGVNRVRGGDPHYLKGKSDPKPRPHTRPTGEHVGRRPTHGNEERAKGRTPTLGAPAKMKSKKHNFNHMRRQQSMEEDGKAQQLRK